MQKSRFFSCLIGLAGLSFVVVQAHAQLSPTAPLSTTTPREYSTANYYFAKPADLTIIVDVVGMVQRPGRYEIASNINLINLIALAGGGNMDAALDDVKITRVSELDGKVFVDEVHVNLEDLSKVKRAALVLRPGDVIQIQKTGWSAFRDVFSVVVGVAVITTAVASVIYASHAR